MCNSTYHFERFDLFSTKDQHYTHAFLTHDEEATQDQTYSRDLQHYFNANTLITSLPQRQTSAKAF